MNIAVIGAGAIGGVVAAYLKKAGEDVVLIGRSDQVDAINAHGLSLKGVRGAETIKLPALTRLDKSYDLVIFAVKTQDIEEAFAHNSEFLEPGGLILTTQNGVQADNILSGHFERNRQLSSIVMFGATYVSGRELSPGNEGDSPLLINPKGAYLEPTVFMDVRNSMSIAQEEIFGPVLSVIHFTSVEEAIHIANDSKYGLAAMIWTKDLEKANKMARRLRCGTVWINTYGVFLNEVPFGGYKKSGFGRELGLAGLFEYTQLKHIATDQTPGGRSLVTSWF